MNFADFYQDNRFAYSIEVFPPKSPAGAEKLLSELKALRAIEPAYVSVTYGAMGTTRENTADLALRIHSELDLATAFHFTCVGFDREQVRTYVEGLAKKGLKLVVALRGDIPADQEAFQPPENGFRYANELVGYLRSLDQGFSLAVAGYPEKHTEAPSLEVDIENLKRKVDAGADVVITQLFYNNDDYYRYVEKVHKAGVRVPIVPGLMPIQNFKQVQKITKMCGASLPKDLLNQLAAHQDDPSAIRDIGVAQASKQCMDLIEQGAPGIHFYTLNKAESVLKVVENCQGMATMG